MTPGVALAKELARRGHSAVIATYAAGLEFLRRSWWPGVVPLHVPNEYFDWPGLHPYDDGVQQVLPLVRSLRPDCLVLGGEYLLADIARATSVPVALLFNTEIFEDVPRNRLAASYFAAKFDQTSSLFPMRSRPNARLLPVYSTLRRLIRTVGPFAPAGRRLTLRRGITALVANGGATDLPLRLHSYSTVAADPRTWVRQTTDFTRTSIRTLLRVLERHDRVFVFSGLHPRQNARLARFARSAGRGLHVRARSMRYYDALASADIVVSRAGNGFIGDLEASNASAVLWALIGHDEQIKNGRSIAALRPNTWFATSALELKNDLILAINAARREPRSQLLPDSGRLRHAATDLETVAKKGFRS